MSTSGHPTGPGAFVPDLHSLIVTTRWIGRCPPGTVGEVIRRSKRTITVDTERGLVSVPYMHWRPHRSTDSGDGRD